MALELHVWGPGFSLPSIDPHCLAAIAYLQRAVPQGEWKLVASSNPTLSPTNELPALRNGDVWIGGFRNIFHYIAQISSGDWVLDAGLAELEGADCIAFSSFVESHGQPLLDLSLYVSSENYTTITRPLYNTIQPFPMPYLTPNTIRTAAKLRTDHLGLSGLDIDTDGTRNQHSIIPESLRTSRTTVSSLLAATPEVHTRIRLDALARNFLEPLRDLLGEKNYLISDKQFSSLDCLALGYLSLMLIPDLPQPWLSKTMRTNFSGLCAWTEELKTRVFGPAVTVEDALLRNSGDPASVEGKQVEKNIFLPWAAPQDRGAVGVGRTYLAILANSIPVVGEYRRNMREEELIQKKTKAVPSPAVQVATIASGILASAGLLLVGYLFHQGIISLGAVEPERQRSNGLDAFGEAGAALSIYANQMDAEVQRQRILEAKSHGPHTRPAVEVEIGSDGTVVEETTG